MDEKAFQSPDTGIGHSIVVDDSEENARALQACELNSDPESDTDSDGGHSIKSTRSFEAHNLESIIENDRKYCNETYFMPNDETEYTRLNIVHQIYLILLDGSLTTVPIPKDACRILDIGTGPGNWAIEMSGMHPNATIIASDIGIFDAGLGHINLPNVYFQLDDARDEWTYHEPFDLVHLRGLSGAFQNWDTIYQLAFKHLTPGGYIEIADTDPAGDTVTFPNSESSYLSIYASAMRSAAEEAGYPRDLSHLRTSKLNAAGFVDVRVLERTIPIGLWPDDLQEKTLGKMALIAFLEGVEAYSLRQLTSTGGWTAEEVRDLCEKVKGELLTANRMTARVRIMTGRKPISRAELKEERRRRVLKRALEKVEEYDHYS
ncbi:hypothetical protein ASPWEDRAFT_261285 [Aspergillus wentii DTO 134E9]|uniref:Methyltransferase domain-containing protein n=1 Tax=Aspergillus wentii DTO 134E9 TaxID=1073089 RepID=A0A1L9S2G0_ASPWE|nr:uncharacterized protein ASPWEDRAFT_261285 [Aspergillus wentii DTO 134E9]KAI9924380.1 hypothetical protein MW887_007006 [Aspergillus wentii]OJJ41334.1 hypothetical protein ASPWEDRAFT_261285 [Aspergillus wentii DTO 134E9]